MDDQITLGALRAAVDHFVAARHWQSYHTPKNLAMSIAIEAAELMEHFQWFTPDEIQQRLGDSEEYGAVADELADILIYCLSFANSAGIDLSSAIHAKLARNESRFPIQARLGSHADEF
jgi:NTP pyrophosphatase (non-canonical NTP hydrolase)